mgnify:FL=1
MKTVALYNLGCKVNSYETEVMAQKLQESGYRLVPFEQEADIYIVNTCTVTNIADRKSRQMLHRARQLNPLAVVVAVGCYVQTGIRAVEADSGIDLAVGNNHKKDIVEILERYLEQRQDKTLRGTTVTDINRACEYEEMQLKQTTEHTRAYIKIQDGCNQFCSYCVIPYARGRVRSRRPEDIMREIRGLVEAGYREVVLTGIHISSYGIDLGEEEWKTGRSLEEKASGRRHPGYNGNSRLIDLTERIHGIEGLDRVRLGSLEPRIINAETARRLAAMPNLCPHFHLSLQSGCDATLKRMNRRYTAGEYYACVEMLREVYRSPAITTDVIVGFPGETEGEFAVTKAFVEKVDFYETHIFKYTRREGTAAASMPGQVPETVKTRRSGELLELGRIRAEVFRSRYIDREAEVLLEERKTVNGRQWLVGHTKDYVRVAVEDKEPAAVNRIAGISVKGFLTDDILYGVYD